MSGPVRASTPASPSNKFPVHFNDKGDLDLISQVTAAENEGDEGKGDFNTLDLGSTIPPAVEEETEERGAAVVGKPLSKRGSLTLQRVKSSLSKRHSQIVELFSRASPSRSGSSRKLGTDQKRSQLDTIIASSSSSAAGGAKGEPKLLAATRKLSSIPTLKEPPQLYQKKSTSTNQLHHLPSSHPQRQVSRRNMMEQINANNPSIHQVGNLPPNKLEEENKKLRQENEQLWEDNRILVASLNDVQMKLDYHQERNKHLELAMHQEGKVLTDRIRESHEEIAKLKQTQCELLANERVNGKILGIGNGHQQHKEENVEEKIREYYIGKYAHSNDFVGGGNNETDYYYSQDPSFQ